MKQKLSAKRALSLVGLASLLFLTRMGPVSAQVITQGYGSDTTIQRATIVSLKLDDAKKVEPTSLDNDERMHGVVVSANDAPFTLSTEDEKTFVATKGRFETFVSNENGTIQPGDYIAISRVAGIGMKAGDKEPYIVGKAVTGFDGEAGVLSTTEIDDNGSAKKVSISRIQVDIGVAGNPLLKPSQANLPGFLQRAAETIANKSPINPVRIYISLFILITAAVVAGILLYSGVRSALISIGRNPLSKKSITRGLLQVIMTSIIILLLGIFGVYLLLRI
ncbi:hypothetical protein KC992_02565 [Candidatus Saccharibacteria bacterium]|nr:hypothetical protein [Candidatus Saccharibacteria bacterium]MCA9328202.1 hypothetical protein [Candidatus Saccharibacteria bacterium]